MAQQAEKTFQYQNSLPSLPVPPLRQTIEKYLDSVRPLVDDAQFENTKRLALKFEAGEGKELHAALVEKSQKERNWLEKWWEHYAYLLGRYPIFPLVNFGGLAPQFVKWPPMLGVQCERAALTTYWVLRYWNSLRKEEIPVQRSRKVIWDMNQFYRFFNSCRVPGENVDHFVHYFKTETEGACPTHIVAMYRGKFWRINVMDEKGNLYTAPQLQRTFENILFVGATTNGSNISALTCDNRTNWWKNREHLISLSSKNREFFETIESSIFIVSFNDDVYTSETDLSHYSIAGDPRNQYADKSFTWHFFKNGVTCTTGEHGNMDAITMVLLSNFVDDNIAKIGFKWNKTESDNNPGPVAIEMPFVTDAQIQKAVNDAYEVWKPLANDLEVNVFHYEGLGHKIFKENKIYGDTVVQVAIQLAYFRLHNKFAATYETASTRKYFHGRTETVRSCTMESVQFARLMLNPHSSLNDRKTAFQKALQKHDKLMEEACDAQGCDRHLCGLRWMAMEKSLKDPEIYSDPSWKKSGGDGNFILSTSFVGYSIVYGGVAPMCADGYGTFYKMMETDITLFTGAWKSSKETNLAAWHESLTWSLNQIAQLLQTSKL